MDVNMTKMYTPILLFLFVPINLGVQIRQGVDVAVVVRKLNIKHENISLVFK